MDVGGALRVGVAQQRVDDTHRGHALGELELLFLCLAGARSGGRLRERCRLTLDHVAKVVLESLLVELERRLDRGGVGEPREHLEPRLLLDEVDRGEVVGVEHRYFELVGLLAIGDDVVATRDRLGDQRERVVFDHRARERDERDAEDVCVRAAQFVFADHVLGGQDIADCLAAVFRFFFCGVEVFCGDKTRVSEKGFEMRVRNVHTRFYYISICENILGERSPTHASVVYTHRRLCS